MFTVLATSATARPEVTPPLVREALPRIVVHVLGVALPLVTGVLVDRVIPRADDHLLVVLTSGVAMLVAFHFVASMIRAHLLLHMRTHVDQRMTLDR